MTNIVRAGMSLQQYKTARQRELDRQRREKIYQGAALFIEHNSSLRSNLPPGANEIESTLRIYR
jgi:hypothetical protein